MKCIYIVFVLFIVRVGIGQTINYSFAASSGAFTYNATPTNLHGTGIDDALSVATNIGFTFQYGCQNYTQFKASSNGWLTFNTAVTSNNAFNNLNTSTDRPIIAPLWDDLATGSGGSVNYKLTGVSPNRILTVEWKQMEWSYSATTWGLSFQVKLYETSNRIEFIYDRNGTAGANLVSPSGSIGLSGISSGNFYSLQDVSAAPVVSSATETSTLNTKPAIGQVYRWDQVSCSGAPTAGIAVATPSANCGPFTTTLTLTGNTASCGITYEWFHCNTAGGTYTSVATATSVVTQTFAITAATPKFFQCVVTCGASSATTAVISASVNPLSAGAGSYSVTLPYSATGLTNCGAGNDITATNISATCGSTSYLGGEDAVYIFSPTVTTAFSGSLTSSSSWVGMTLYQGCPTSTGVCVDYAQSSSGNQSITSCTNVLTAGLTYYLIVDAFPSPTCHPAYALDLSMNGCSGIPTAGTAVASPSINCSNYTTTLSLTGSTSGCGLTYQWFYSNAAAGTYTAISASSGTSTQTFAVTGTTYFMGVVTCGASSATTSAIMAVISPTSVGAGTYSVALPYSITGQTTCGFGNDITSSNVTNICGSSSYYTGEDVVYVFTPTTTAVFNATVTSTGSYTGLMLYNGCPTGTGSCVANNQSSTGTKTLSAASGTCATSATVTAGTTYFLVLDSYAAPTCNPYDLAMATTPISSSTVTPCNFNYTAASTTFSFETFTGTLLPTTDDVLFNTYISLGFPFCFDGGQYTGGYVASNSSFVFDAVPCFPNIQTSTYAAGGVSTGYTISGAAPLNGTSVPRNAILAPWHDINPASTSTVAASKIQYQVTGTSPNRKAVISWENIPMYSSACETVTASRASSQVKIFEIDGSIEIHIKNKQVCSSWNGGDAILGLHNYNGTSYIPPVNATAHNYPTDWTMTNTAYRFTTPCSSTGACLTTLPIGFKDFYGDRIDHVNTLFWSTATEENMDYYIIERSIDGLNFINIGKVMAKNTPSSYTYKDYESIVGMINYYRIRAVEKNRITTVTKIISIGESDDELLSTWPIYPNPSNTEINIRLNSKKNGGANILIYDVVGKVVIDQYQDVKVGVKVYSVDVSQLQAGVYFVEIKNDLNETLSKQKLIKQ